jgi:2-(3-amino-3-carboxypropyl)histidine synthase
MKLFHVLTKYEGDIQLPGALLKQLPKSIMLASTVQFSDQIPRIRGQLEKIGKKVELFQGVHDEKAGQILGCDIFQSGKKVDGYLYVGDGLFHPTALLYDNELTVYYYNPFNEEIVMLTPRDLQRTNNRKKASMARFLAAEKVGILVTTKPGQNNIKGAQVLQKRLEEKGKQAYIFVDETLSMLQLENFPFIDCWVNTACPRIVEDSNYAMVNLWDLREIIMKGFGVKVV